MIGFAVAGATPPDSLSHFGDFGWMLLKTALILAVICICAYLFIRFVLRRFLPPAGRRSSPRAKIILLDRLVLEPRRSLQVVRVGSTVLLLALSDGQINLLCRLDPAQWMDGDEGQPPGTFGQTLRTAMARSEASEKPRSSDLVALPEVYPRPEPAQTPWDEGLSDRTPSGRDDRQDDRS